MGTAETIQRIDAAADHLAALLNQLDERTVSGRPVRVALVGLPNAGKSSLFNALAGGDALVSPVPGTTRDYLTREIDLGGVRVELIDTAGWQTAADTIEEQAQRLGRDAASGADVILWCAEHGRFDAAGASRLAAVGADVVRVRTKCDLANSPGAGSSEQVLCSVPHGTDAVRTTLGDAVAALARPALAPSQSRCRHHVAACLDHLRATRTHVATADPPELAAAALRAALDQLGELTGAVYTNDLLDRVFSRFCIGK